MAWDAGRTEQEQTLVIPSPCHENHGALGEFFGGEERRG